MVTVAMQTSVIHSLDAGKCPIAIDRTAQPSREPGLSACVTNRKLIRGPTPGFTETMLYFLHIFVEDES